MIAILGKKIGMTQLFNEAGEKVSVTVIEAGPCAVMAVKPKAVKLGFGNVKEKSVKKPELGLFKKLNISPRYLVREVDHDAAGELKVGDEIKADIFACGDFVDVTGVSKGKGFQGGMKRWHWAGGPETHGHTSHRRVGSIGSTTTPGRVWRGHHMPGHMGAERVTTQNLMVVRVDAANNILVIKGAVPGHNNSYCMIRKAKKKKAKV